MNEFEIHPLSASDWRAYKFIRLLSLKESPDSFGSTFEREVLFSDDTWKSRLCSSESNIDSVIWAALIDGGPVGLVSGVLHNTNPGCTGVYQMWVTPRYRGMGLGSTLINRVIEWTRENGGRKLQLSVNTDNKKALSIYRKAGFIPVGSQNTLRKDSTLMEQPMELTIMR